MLESIAGSNVFAVKDANFDMDIDPNFDEASEYSKTNWAILTKKKLRF